MQINQHVYDVASVELGAPTYFPEKSGTMPAFFTRSILIRTKDGSFVEMTLFSDARHSLETEWEK